MDTGPIHSYVGDLISKPIAEPFSDEGAKQLAEEVRTLVEQNEYIQADMTERSILLDALRAIRDGHDDPQNVAKRTLEVVAIEFPRIFHLLLDLPQEERAAVCAILKTSEF
jgi:hypothetical protein